jgi:hypothetical protein
LLPRVPDSSVKIAVFAKDQLDLLVEEISTSSPALDVSDADMVGALILAARRSPREAIKAGVLTYWDQRVGVAAAIAVCGFIGAYGVTPAGP